MFAKNILCQVRRQFAVAFWLSAAAFTGLAVRHSREMSRLLMVATISSAIALAFLMGRTAALLLVGMH
jgi:hypothetical protein